MWNKTNSKTHVKNPEGDWIVHEDNHDPIITKEMFLKRKDIGQNNIGKGFQSNAHKAQWLLAKMIRCDVCGKAYVGVRRKRVTGEKGNKTSYFLNRYVCSGHISQGQQACKSFYIDQEYLEQAVVNLIRNEITRPVRLREIEATIKERLKQVSATRSETEKQNHIRLAEINQGIERFYDAIATGLDPDICKRKIEELQQQKALLDNELHTKEADARSLQALENDMLLIRKMARNFTEEFETLPFERQRMLLLHFVERIDIVDHSIAQVHLRIPKLTPGTVLKPPMAKKTLKEMELEKELKTMDRMQNASPDRDQVRQVRLPETDSNRQPSG